MKKFAVCFSGYPRFVRECFGGIKKNFLDGLGEYDVYANFQWNDDWQNTPIHHEFADKYGKDELSEFIELYTPLNLKDIKVIQPYNFDTSFYDKLSAEPDMVFETVEKSRSQFYRSKCQYQGISDCVKLVDPNDYEFIVRIRTDSIFHSELDFSQLETNNILCQDGYEAGWDRHYSDWFFIVPTNKINFFHDLANVEEHYKNGIIHMHKLVEKVGKPYNIEHHQFNITTASICSYKNTEKFLEIRK